MAAKAVKKKAAKKKKVTKKATKKERTALQNTLKYYRTKEQKPEKGTFLQDALDATAKKLQETADGMQFTTSAGPPPRPQTMTRLTEKAYSPLVIRKITKFGFPIYVAVITDDGLDRLDEVIVSFIKEHIGRWKSDSIDDKRWIGGALCDRITEEFQKTEGVAVILYIDKTCISSLYGDFMNHAMCRSELYTLLVMGTAV